MAIDGIPDTRVRDENDKNDGNPGAAAAPTSDGPGAPWAGKAGKAGKTGKSGWAAVRPLLLRLHFYAGVLIAPLLFLAAVTGLLYALSFQAEKIIYSDELTVAKVGQSALPLSEQVKAAQEAAPKGEVVGVWPGPDAEATTRVVMESPEVGAEETLTVFVDPYTAEVRGKLATSGDALPLRAWLSEFHASLQLGESGRIYSELAASWMWVVALGGLALWIGRRRDRKAQLLVPDRKAAPGRRRTLSWHGAVGLWAAAGLVVLSATGLTWSTYAGENIGQLQDRLGGATPSVSASIGGGADAGADEHAGHKIDADGNMVMPPRVDVGVDKVLAAARAAGVTESVQITMPANGKGYVVKERDKTFPVHLDAVSVDPADGRVMDELRFADYPLLAQLTRFGIDVHMGLLFGLVNQLALAALAIGLMFLVFWGYRMWWLRRPTKERALSVGRAQPRGAWRKLPVTVLLPLAAVTALVGWFVPLLGISLVAFLVVDVLLGLVAGRRDKAAAA